MTTKILPQQQQQKQQVNPPLAYLSQSFRHVYLALEYKQLRDTVPEVLKGLYVAPSKETIEEWDGVIFIRAGVFRKGIFKFKITFPPNYPYAPPSITFINKIFHPQISEDGRVDLTRVHANLEPMKHNVILHSLMYLKRIFYSLDDTNIANQRAYDLWKKDTKGSFQARAKIDVQQSIDQAYDTPPNSSIVFTKYEEKHEKTKQALVAAYNKAHAQAAGGQQKNNSYTPWFLDAFAAIAEQYGGESNDTNNTTNKNGRGTNNSSSSYVTSNADTPQHQIGFEDHLFH
eukprot:GEZU01018183.1.p1 GENE.GEZU01018183.1~~GEZU01018183.1.p1  ORF type:complete len:287 (-),score=66.90 GEZU01018183.1:251-1111(-)